jgi:hypothetical protein
MGWRSRDGVHRGKVSSRGMRFSRTWIALFFLIAFASGCGEAKHPVVAHANHLDVSIAHNSPGEIATRAQLERLVATYDVGAWLFTKTIVISEGEIPHSHPVLTLNTRHLKQDDELLATLIHEEMHWFLDAHKTERLAAMIELRANYPQLPVGAPDGADSEDASYEHLIVNELEWRALVLTIGEARANSVFEFWAGDHYRVLYRLVMNHGAQIDGTLRAHRLLPPGIEDAN